MSVIEAFAETLDTAAATATAVAQLGDGLTLDQAYAVQQASIARRIGRGETRVGIKMGFTSRAKRIQMGVDDVIWGRLTSGMRVDEGGSIRMDHFVHPRVEPEIAFILKRALPARVSALEAQAAIEAVAPALEIIDSRYRDFRFSLTDVVADNASSSAFVLGNPCAPDCDVANRGMVLAMNGQAMEIGSSAAIMGHPLRSLVAAARLAAEAGEPLAAGDIVLAGGATAAIALAPGAWIDLSVGGMGQLGFGCE